ncbi:hypothetical protein [Pseudoxanthomonas sp. UTMC 1351]|uniref:hypothetical protein n=1 Tax=Pseudoxanthomonas sp. UTMC 1351 TaxID=2695853 RepID=UPI0034CD2B01
MILFFALCFVGVAIAGFCAFVIFWPLTLVHVRDRHADLSAQWGPGAFLKLEALRWLMSGQYRASRDTSLSGLATPARVAMLVILVALVMAGLLWLWSVALA